ncbi:MAG TPA: GNAT family N-acetyltransferase [Gemmatimonadaceae bacterium]|nr:GNAT family N-acetyltransferase [Gemmatimonadaceae bacterium]
MSRTPVTVSPAADDEVEAVVALMRSVIEPLAYYNAPAIASELAKYSADALRALRAGDPQALLVARDGGALAGFCVSRFDDGTIWLSWFGVAAGARGRGVGGALIAELQATLPSRGAHKIWCDSRTDNVESCAVLERAGFQRVATLTDHWHHQDYYLWEWHATGERHRSPPATR